MKWRVALLVVAGVAVAAPVVVYLWSFERPHVSDDLTKLQDTVVIPAGATSARWEIYGTPEYTGGVPGPTDYITLIAELQPALAPAAASAGAQEGEIAVTPEAARPWLSDGFRALMKQSVHARLHLAAHKNCRAYETTVRKSGRRVPGFWCTDAGRTLLYLDVT